MPNWDSSQYLRFARERTQAAIDLAARIDLPEPTRIIDLGCGPGNSTAVLALRWPAAQLEGLDTSEEMLATARLTPLQTRWISGDIATWRSDQAYDLVYANAALQWVPDHGEVLPRLFAQVAARGALAFQVPADADAPARHLMRALAHSAKWKDRFPTLPREWRVESADRYYDLLSPKAARIDLWVTDYLHVLADVPAIAEWYRGTGLRPWLQALATDQERDLFLADYRAGLAATYPLRPDGKVLFPFRRLFVIAYR